MKIQNLSESSRAIIQQLLAEKGIFLYEITEAIFEGKTLPGGDYSSEVTSLSGTIVTPTTAYCFWLDWVDGHYTLGEAKGEGYWSEISQESSRIAGIQQRLKAASKRLL